MSVRRTIGVLGAGLACGAGAMSLAATAAAAPYVASASIAVSANNPCPGGTLVVSGRGWEAGERVDTVLTPGQVGLGSARADATGDFRASISMPDDVLGARTLVATGRSSGATASADLVVRDCSGLGAGNLPKTGAQVAAIAAAGAVLVGTGVVLVRRRRAAV